MPPAHWVGVRVPAGYTQAVVLAATLTLCPTPLVLYLSFVSGEVPAATCRVGVTLSKGASDMMSLFWGSLLLGGAVTLLQFAATAIGLDHDLHADAHDTVSDGLNLFSVRAIAAGLAFFGLAGVAGARLGFGAPLSVIGALAAGGLAAIGVAVVMRAMLRLNTDRTFRLSGAVGTAGNVYLSIPAARSGTGKVHLSVQQRIMELDAVTPADAIETGTRVLVIDVIAPATVVVVPEPDFLNDGET